MSRVMPKEVVPQDPWGLCCDSDSLKGLSATGPWGLGGPGECSFPGSLSPGEPPCYIPESEGLGLNVVSVTYLGEQGRGPQTHQSL